MSATCFAPAAALDFATVRAAVFANPYAELPHYVVDSDLFGARGDRSDNHLLAAARRTLSSEADLLEFPAGQKLFQPNGICFAGTWHMTAQSDYTGLFATGTTVSAIVRASVMLGETTREHKRAFGIAIKLFPGTTAADASTVNLFVMESMGGTVREHVTSAVLDNHPGLGSLPRLGMLGTALRIRSDLTRADRALSPAGANLRYRPVAPAARVGLADGAVGVAPGWLRLSVAPGTARVDAEDFRDELRLEHYPDRRLDYLIEAAPPAASKRVAVWQTLGTLSLEQSVTSLACDTRLHFAHPLNE